MILAAALLAAATPAIRSSPELGQAEGRCRPSETGPAFLVSVEGLKDRQGLIKLEVYPANDGDFLADDNVLVAAHKVFRRVEQPLPAQGAVQMCIRVPAAGRYAVLLLHDRDANHKFGLSVDGVGFSSNPKLGLGKPKAASAAIDAGNGPTAIMIRLNYRRGLFSFAPIDQEAR